MTSYHYWLIIKWVHILATILILILFVTIVEYRSSAEINQENRDYYLHCCHNLHIKMSNQIFCRWNNTIPVLLHNLQNRLLMFYWMQTGLSKKLHLLCPPSPLLFILSKGAGFEVILVKVRLYIYLQSWFSYLYNCLLFSFC